MDLFFMVILPLILLTVAACIPSHNTGSTKHVIQPKKHECPLCNGVGWIQPGMLERFRDKIRDE